MSSTVPRAFSYHLLKSIPVRRGSVSSLWSPGPSPSLGGHAHTCFFFPQSSSPPAAAAAAGCPLESVGAPLASSALVPFSLLCAELRSAPVRCALRLLGVGGVGGGVFLESHTHTHACTLLNGAYRSASPPLWKQPGYRSVPPARISRRAVPDAAAGEQWLPDGLLLSIGNIHRHHSPQSVSNTQLASLSHIPPLLFPRSPDVLL